MRAITKKAVKAAIVGTIWIIKKKTKTLFTSQEVITAIGITSKYDNTCLNNHSDQSDDQSVEVPCAVQGFCKEPFEVIKTEIDIAVELEGYNVTGLKRLT